MASSSSPSRITHVDRSIGIFEFKRTALHTKSPLQRPGNRPAEFNPALTRKHYDSKNLTRYQRRKVVRQSWRYRFWKWLRRNRALQRLDTISTHVRYLSLATLAAYFFTVLQAGPGSGLLPPPWDERVCWAGGIAFTIAQIWLGVASYWKEERAKLARMEKLLKYKESARRRELK